MNNLFIPDSVKVGTFEYTVADKDIVILNERTNYAGAIDYVDLEIELLADLHPQRRLETFFHEVFHAIMYEAGYKEHDEELVERVSKVLYQVMRDNYFYMED